MTLLKKMLNHILLVEDNEANRRLMKEACKTASFEGKLDIVVDGNKVMPFLKREGEFASAPLPDIILLDLNLPGKSGIDVLEEIRSDKNFDQVSVVVLTGSNSALDIEACSKLRCKYLLKPSRFHELVELIKSLPDFC